MFRSISLMAFMGYIVLGSCTNSGNTPFANTKASTKTESKNASSKTNSSPRKVGDSIVLDSAIKEILSFPEIQKENEYIDSFSHGMHHIAYIIDSPSKGAIYYSVHMGYNGADRFETYNLFYIYIHIHNFNIRVFDPSSENDDGTYSIEEWRKHEKESEK